ncbi:MAG TPA: DAK2 domain-containing protein [Anaerolineae bacterium]|nr:DAK2 domain-containing protein [Anaerolineae bacterium]
MSARHSSQVLQVFEIENDPVFRSDGAELGHLFRAGTRWLELHVQHVNNINVFPVADGDTGVNMLLTMQAALETAEQVAGREAGRVAEALAQGALMGGRGNSGVILSQFLQGLAAGLAGKSAFTSSELAAALRLGANQAWLNVIDPVEGTILTVARAAAEAAEVSSRTEPDLTVLWTAIVSAMRAAQAATPQLLPLLRDAGVTDSGGQGLLYIFEGGLRYLRREPMDTPGSIAVAAPVRYPSGESSQAYYDVQFLIKGDRLDLDDIRTRLASLGESILVVGTEQLVRVHIHVADPQAPLRLGAKIGTVSQVVVENLTRQAEFFSQQPVDGPSAVAVVAVVAGLGFVEVFQKECLVLGYPVDVDDLLRAVQQVRANQVLILPNDRDTISIAQPLEALPQKAVRIVPTQTMPQGIAALLSFNERFDADVNARRMAEAARQVRTIEVRDRVTQLNGHSRLHRDVTVWCDGRLLCVGSNPVTAALEALAQVEAENYELITLYPGQNSGRDLVEMLTAEIQIHYPDAELDVFAGEQAHVYFIISLE